MYRDLIFECAERVFGEQGFEGATMKDIAAEAGISLKTLYATFPGKLEIYREVRRARARQFLQHVASALEGEGSTWDRIARGMRAYVDVIVAHRDFLRIQLREGQSWGLGPSGEDRNEWRAGVKMQAELVRAGIKEGIFYDGDPELIAATGIAVMQVQLAGLLERSPQADAQTIADEILRQLERLLCRTPRAAEPTRRTAA
jgi:AcrR family transcriptional regulator